MNYFLPTAMKQAAIFRCHLAVTIIFLPVFLGMEDINEIQNFRSKQSLISLPNLKLTAICSWIRKWGVGFYTDWIVPALIPSLTLSLNLKEKQSFWLWNVWIKIDKQEIYDWEILNNVWGSWQKSVPLMIHKRILAKMQDSEAAL